MSVTNLGAVPVDTHMLTEYEALTSATPTTLDAIPGAVYVCDHEGRVVRYNSEASALWGRSPDLGNAKERFCGSLALFLPDGTPLPHDECPMAEAVRAGTPTRNAEVTIERPDGSRVDVVVNVRCLRDRRGEIQGAINCFQDISAQKAAEEEVRLKNRDLEDFFENSAVGLHIVSRDWHHQAREPG